MSAEHTTREHTMNLVSNPSRAWVSDSADELVDSAWTTEELAGMLARETNEDYAVLVDAGRCFVAVGLARAGIDLARFNFRKS
jgi:hypothetical protein